jgi:hypothetical protein
MSKLHNSMNICSNVTDNFSHIIEKLNESFILPGSVKILKKSISDSIMQTENKCLNDTYIDSELLREILDYDQYTGIFRWKVRVNINIKVGQEAGRTTKGFRMIGVDYKHYLAHRLAWMYVTGYWPEGAVIHLDGNLLNNSFSNLAIRSK